MKKQGRVSTKSEQRVQLHCDVNKGLASITVMTTLSHNVKLVSSESLDFTWMSLEAHTHKHTHAHRQWPADGNDILYGLSLLTLLDP